jgi:hypothetical protein
MPVNMVSGKTMIETIADGITPAVTPLVTEINLSQYGKFMAIAVDNDTDQALKIYTDDSRRKYVKIAAQSVRDNIILENVERIFLNVPAVPVGSVTIDITDMTAIMVQNRVVATKQLATKPPVEVRYPTERE